MKLLTLVFIALIATTSSMASESCKDHVISAYELLGRSIKADSFSTARFEDFGLTIEEFNNLSSDEQESIYSQIKPLDVVIEQTIDDLNRKIEQVVGTFYEFFMAEQISAWRAKRETLRDCLPEQKRLKYKFII